MGSPDVPAPVGESAPPENRADRIRRLCREWCKAVAQPDGSLTIGPEAARLRLHSNGIVFHELSHVELQVACVELSRVLLLPRANTVIDVDHFLLWTWIAQLLQSQSTVPEARDVRKLLGLCVRAALAAARPPAQDDHSWWLQGKIEELIPHHLRWLGMDSSLVLTHLAFPALEGTLKLACRSLVDLAGMVRADFEVPSRRSGATPVQYSVTGKGSRQCSSIRDLLLLHHDQVASAELRARVGEIRDHIASLHPGEDGFEVLYGWRNGSLHGAESYPTIGGTVLTLAQLIAFEDLAGDFEKARADTWRGVEWQGRLGTRSPRSFYPPF